MTEEQAEQLFGLLRKQSDELAAKVARLEEERAAMRTELARLTGELTQVRAEAESAVTPPAQSAKSQGGFAGSAGENPPVDGEETHSVTRGDAWTLATADLPRKSVAPTPEFFDTIQLNEFDTAAKAGTLHLANRNNALRLEDPDDKIEPEDMESEEYEEWGEAHEDLEDQVDEILDLLEDMK